MQGIGFVDDVAVSKLGDIARVARKLLSEADPVVVNFHRPVIRPEAIALAPAPFEPVQKLRTTIREAIASVPGGHAVPDSADGFQPQISLAYVNVEQPATDVLRAIEGVSLQPVRVEIPAVSLIEMHRDRRMYEWRTLESVTIGS